MVELLIGFKNLDLDFIDNRLLLLIKTIVYKEKLLR
jgi:hypothetical protein